MAVKLESWSTLYNNNNANWDYTQFLPIRLDEFQKFDKLTVGEIIGK